MSHFKTFTQRPFTAYCNVSKEYNGGVRNARFGITGLELSVLLTEKTEDKIMDSMMNSFLEDLQAGTKGVLYYQYTGSHFQLIDKPDWADEI